MKLIFLLIGSLVFCLKQNEAKYLKQISYKIHNSTKDLCNGKCDPCANYETGTVIPIPNEHFKFNACLNEKTEVFQCPYGRQFNHLKLRCDPIADNHINTNNHKQIDSTFQNHKNLNICHLFDLKRDVSNCHSFYACRDGRFSKTFCPKGYYFNQQVERCELIADRPAHKCSCLFPQNAVLSNPNDCQSYYVCDNGLAQLKTCPFGSYFNERISTCIPDYDHVCHNDYINQTPLEVEASTSICTDWKTELLSDETDCNKYILCANGEAFHMKCPKGFYFNNISRACVIDKLQNCSKLYAQTAESPNDNDKKSELDYEEKGEGTNDLSLDRETENDNDAHKAFIDKTNNMIHESYIEKNTSNEEEPNMTMDNNVNLFNVVDEDSDSEQIDEPEIEDTMIVEVDSLNLAGSLSNSNINMKLDPFELNKPQRNTEQGSYDKLTSKFNKLS